MVEKGGHGPTPTISVNSADPFDTAPAPDAFLYPHSRFFHFPETAQWQPHYLEDGFIETEGSHQVDPFIFYVSPQPRRQVALGATIRPPRMYPTMRSLGLLPAPVDP